MLLSKAFSGVLFVVNKKVHVRKVRLRTTRCFDI